jgi:type I restriction enzyme M protein
MRIAEFDIEKGWWNSRQETERAWLVSIEDVVASGYNLDAKNPNTVLPGHEDPDELLAKYEIAAADVRSAQESLRTILLKALGRS